MLSFEEFQSFVADSIKSYLPPEYVNADVRLTTVKKDNDIELSAICILKKDADLAPNIYLNGYYDDYAAGNITMNDVLNNVTAQRMKAELMMPKMNFNMNSLEASKERIVPKIINAHINKELLEDRPHKIMGDLAVTYRIIAGRDNGGVMSAVIDNKVMEKFGLNLDELHELAITNMRKETPSKVCSMAELLCGDLISQMVSDGMSEEMAIEMVNDMTKDAPMYVITNIDGVNGAAAVLDTVAMETLREKIGSDILLMPSSIHEIISIPYSEDMDLDYIKDMVAGINCNIVSENDFLSNSVYKYDFDKKELVFADTKEKKIESTHEHQNTTKKGSR